RYRLPIERFLIEEERHGALRPEDDRGLALAERLIGEAQVDVQVLTVELGAPLRAQIEIALHDRDRDRLWRAGRPGEAREAVADNHRDHPDRRSEGGNHPPALRSSGSSREPELSQRRVHGEEGEGHTVDARHVGDLYQRRHPDLGVAREGPGIAAEELAAPEFG